MTTTNNAITFYSVSTTGEALCERCRYYRGAYYGGCLLGKIDSTSGHRIECPYYKGRSTSDK
jgi:hypothetical protein